MLGDKVTWLRAELLRGGAVLAVAGTLLLGGSPAQACTLYAAQGTAVVGGGAIVAKNRDWRPEPQSVHMREPGADGQYRYFGLYAGDYEQHQLRGGVNERGLVAYSAAVSSVTKRHKAADAEEYGAAKGTLRKVLERYATVEEALAHPDVFRGCRFVMLGDSTEVAYVEGGLAGKLQIVRQQNGVLAHTNHYLTSELAPQNERYYESSHVRLQRVQELLTAQPQLALADFVRIGEDRSAGANDSLWRVGDAEHSTQTVAQMVVAVRPDRDFTVYVKYREQAADAGREKVVRLTRQEIFGAAAKGNR